jgi:hypothetical protein
MDEKTGIAFTVTIPNPDGSIKSVDKQHATLVEGRLSVTGGAPSRSGPGLTLMKDPRRPDPGGRPAYYLPPGTPTVYPAARPAGGGGGGAPPPRAPYWQPGPFKALRQADIVGTWIAASFGPLGMDKQIFTFLRVGDRLRGVVCGRCDNAYTLAALERVTIIGDTLYFQIAHQDRGNIEPPVFDRTVMAQIVQNEMIASCWDTTSRSIPPIHRRVRPELRSRSSARSPQTPQKATAPKASTSGGPARVPRFSRRRTLTRPARGYRDPFHRESDLLMRLVTLRNGTPDGALAVVSSDGLRCLSASEMAPTLQAALDDWKRVEGQLRRLAAAVESGDGGRSTTGKSPRPCLARGSGSMDRRLPPTAGS